MIFYLHKLQNSLFPYQNGNNAIFVQLQYYYLAFHHHRNIYQGQYMSHLTLFTNSSLSSLECYFEWLQGKLRIPGSHQDPFFFFLNENEYQKKKKSKKNAISNSQDPKPECHLHPRCIPHHFSHYLGYNLK